MLEPHLLLWVSDATTAILFHELTKPGKSLAYTRVDFTNPAGDLVAYGCKTRLQHSETIIDYCHIHQITRNMLGNRRLTL
jgi:hypothetical protein